MAIFHHSEFVVSRSTGRSTVQTAAYISGTKIYETRRKLTADFRKRKGSVMCWEQLVPDNAPDFCRELLFWDELENFEDQWARTYFKQERTLEKHLTSAQVGHTVVVALPKELDKKTHQTIAYSIAQRAFVSQGHVVLYALHDDEGNPHAHFLVSRRTITEEGRLSLRKSRALSIKEALLERRQWTAEMINQALEKAYIDQQVNHHSFNALGIEFIPTRHEGYAARKRLQEGQYSRIREENDSIKACNQTTAIEYPEVILKELTAYQDTFSAKRAAFLVQKRVGDNPFLVSATYQAVMQLSCVVGIGVKGELRYMPKSTWKQTGITLEKVDTLLAKRQTFGIFPKERKSIWAMLGIGRGAGDEGSAGGVFSRLLRKWSDKDRSSEKDIRKETAYTSSSAIERQLIETQRTGIDHLCQDQVFQVLLSRGKLADKNTLKALVQRYQRQGYTVFGAAQCIRDVAPLRDNMRCRVNTLNRWLYQWDRFSSVYQKIVKWHARSQHAGLIRTYEYLLPDQLSSRHVLILQGTEHMKLQQWTDLLEAIQKKNARVILITNESVVHSLKPGSVLQEIFDKAQAKGSVHKVPDISREVPLARPEMHLSGFKGTLLKEPMSDYTIKSKNKEAWKTVQQYRDLGQELAVASQFYQKLSTERIQLGRKIIEEWPKHAKYVEHAGFTRESIMAQCGYKVEKFTSLERESKAERGESQHSQKSAGDSHAVSVIYSKANICSALTDRITELAHDLLGKPSRSSPLEWRYGRKGSLAIRINGVHQGLWSNFETGQSGGVLQLIQVYAGLSDRQEVFQWASEWLGEVTGSRRVVTVRKQKTNQKVDSDSWQLVQPIPKQIPKPNLVSDPHLNRGLIEKEYKEIDRYAYRDQEGHLLGYTVRLENRQGQKVILPLTYGKSDRGITGWRWKGFLKPRPLYGLDLLSRYPKKPVLLVEGEKTANAAQKLFKGYITVSWPGGVGSIKYVDWDPLVGREVVCWPDNDAAGIKAMHWIRGEISRLNAARDLWISVRCVRAPEGIPEKWDLADAIPSGWNTSTLEKLIQGAEFSSTGQTKVCDTLPWYDLESATVQRVIERYRLNSLVRNESYFSERVKLNYQTSLEVVKGLELKEQKHALNELALQEHVILMEFFFGYAKKSYGISLSRLESALYLNEIAAYAAHYARQNPNINKDVSKLLEIGLGIKKQRQTEQSIRTKDIQQVYQGVTQREAQLWLWHVERVYQLTGVELNISVALSVMPAIQPWVLWEANGEIAKMSQALACSLKGESECAVTAMTLGCYLRKASQELQQRVILGKDDLYFKKCLDQAIQSTREVYFLEGRHASQQEVNRFAKQKKKEREVER